MSVFPENDSEGPAKNHGGLAELDKYPRPIDKYLRLRDLREENPNLYYELLMDHTETVLPFIYTPTVGEACQRYHELLLRPSGLYITLEDTGRILDMLRGLGKDKKVIVVTDGERILGLGDLGANGMGISEGKISLYTAAAGMDPEVCLPICLDLGTNNKSLLTDPLYMGLRRKRASATEFDKVLAEFMSAVRTVWGHGCVVQFEDFGNTNAFRLLKTFQDLHPCFNDDIQGTASITLSAILSAVRLTSKELRDQRILFFGAGEAGTGIGELVTYSLHHRNAGLSIEAARSVCFFLDSKGLVCKSRSDLQEHKLHFAHDVPFCPDLKAALAQLKPTILIGVSAQPGAFDEEVLRYMSSINERPIIMPLSNPTSQAECTFEEAYRWTSGQVIFASGSPFPPIPHPTALSLMIYPAQANNAYIFPAVGHAASLMGWRTIPQEAFLIAAEVLSEMTSSEEDRTQGRLFPEFSKITSVSAGIMARLCAEIPPSPGSQGWQGGRSAAEWLEMVEGAMWTRTKKGDGKEQYKEDRPLLTTPSSKVTNIFGCMLCGSG